MVYDRLVAPALLDLGAPGRGADLRGQGTGPRARAAARHRTVAGGTRARRRGRRAPEGRRPVRLRTRRRRGRGVRGGRASRARSCRVCRRPWPPPPRPGSRSPIGVWPVRSRSSPARPRTTTRSISRGVAGADTLVVLMAAGRLARDVRRPHRGRPSCGRARRDRPVGMDPGPTRRWSARSRTSRSSPKRRASARPPRSSSVPSQRSWIARTGHRDTQRPGHPSA